MFFRLFSENPAAFAECGIFVQKKMRKSGVCAVLPRKEFTKSRFCVTIKQGIFRFLGKDSLHL